MVAGSKVPILGKLGYALYGALTRPKAGDAPLKNLGTLSDTVRRGAQPTEAGYAELKREGVDTVINLRPEAPWAEAMALAQGLRCIDMPLPAIGACTNAQAMAFLKAAVLWAKQGRQVAKGLCVWNHEQEPILRQINRRSACVIGWKPARKGE